MNANQISILLAADRCEVNIFAFAYSSPEKKWSVKIIKKEDGVNLEVMQEGSDLESAMIAAYERYQRVVSKGIPEFAGPLLEHQPTFREEINDEIPF